MSQATVPETASSIFVQARIWLSLSPTQFDTGDFVDPS